MRTTLRPLLSAAAATLLSAAAHAHFIWIHLQPGPPARVEVLFGDGVHQDTDRTLVRYVEDLELRLADGTPIALERHPWGLSGDLPAGATLLAATRDMGVFERPGSGEAVKLDYDSKAALDVSAAGRDLGMTTEIVLHAEGDELVAQVRFRGEPAAGALLFVPRADAPGEREVATDAEGRARIARPADGVLQLKARVTVPRAGEHEGRAFSAEHHYAMLTVTDPRPADAPAVAGSLEAHQLVAEAERVRARLPDDVVGLAGVLWIHHQGEPVRGEFEVSRGRLVQCDVPGLAEDLRALVARHVEALVVPLVTRGPGDRAHALALAPRDGSPLGRLVAVADGARTELRVHEGAIRERASSADGVRTVVQVLALGADAEGRPCPEQLARLSFDEGSGALLASESIHDAYVERNGLRLPASRRILAAGAGGARSLRIELANLEIERSADAR